MSEAIIKVSEDFWNIRGSFKIAGLLDVGTQSSLVRRASGKFVLLDAYSFDEETAAAIAAVTNNDEDIDAIINLHPFHTMHVANAAEAYPNAKLYGTARHKQRQPELDWEDLESNDLDLHAMFEPELQFSVPQGVDFISADENVHFSSVLVMHPASGTIHSDDTFNYLAPSGLIRLTGMGDSVSFHPTLGKALKKEIGAAQEFRDWARLLIAEWSEAENLCAAHTGTLLGRDNQGPSLHDRLQTALEKVEKTLRSHESKYGR